ncbi:MAG TPA: CHAT domain-containing protein [Thermoanaerobaculia bacterium]
MKNLLLIVMILCSGLTFCSRPTDKFPQESWGRRTALRAIDDTPWARCAQKQEGAESIIPDLRCGNVEAPPPAPENCNVADVYALLQIAIDHPHCADRAISALQGFPATDARARNALAVAYYVRAHRDQAADDLLNALAAADDAVAPTPVMPAALFNRALLLEVLGVQSEAIKAWSEFLKVERPGWSREARERRDRLTSVHNADALWQRSLPPLRAALRTNDAATVLKLIAESPAAARSYFEDEILYSYAMTPTPQLAAEARMFATALASVANNDRFWLDAVQAIENAALTPAALSALRTGHQEFRAGRQLGGPEAVATYARAAGAFAAGKSPLSLIARVNLANQQNTIAGEHIERALADVATVEREARSRGYHHLVALVQASRGYLQFLRDPLKSLDAYDAAVASYRALGDAAGLAAALARRGGIYALLGNQQLSLLDVVQSGRRASSVVTAQGRNAVLTENSQCLTQAGHSRAALLYAEQALEWVQMELKSTPCDNEARIQHLRKNVGVALRARAIVRLGLDQVDEARKDLVEAATYNADAALKAEGQQALAARLQDVNGRVNLKLGQYEAAIAAFDSALRGTPEHDLLSFRANVLAQRAIAKRRAGRRRDEVNRDLEAALATLHREEETVLGGRIRGEGEKVLTGYFSRFEDTYQLLIRQYVEANNIETAFEVAEQRRAVELLDLIASQSPASGTLRPLPRERRRLAEIQRDLPAGTILISYSVLDDQTYCWLVTRDGVGFEVLRIGRADIAERAERLASAIGDPTLFEGTLAGASALLPAAAHFQRLAPAGATPLPRIVFIPDGPMHGIPLGALRHPLTKRPLIESAIPSFAGSAALYVHSLARDAELSSTAAPSALLVGNPSFDRRLSLARDLDDLTAATQEVHEIARYYAPNAETLVEREATRDHFLAMARAKTVVHFAGHALVNPKLPSNSLLLFAQSGDDSGAVAAHDLLKQLSLDQTRLVVLAACSSAGGLPVGPEGVAPLVRPIIAARVPAVVGTLWSVPDDTAKQFFVSFHCHFKNGDDAALALRNAQIDVLKKKTRSGESPVLRWAPYQVIGHAASPFGSQTNDGGTHHGLHSENSLQRNDCVCAQRGR